MQEKNNALPRDGFLTKKIPAYALTLSLCVNVLLIGGLFYNFGHNSYKALGNNQKATTQQTAQVSTHQTAPVQTDEANKIEFLPSPFLGIYMRQVPSGVEVTKVMPGSAASDAGILVGDIILQAGPTTDLSGFDTDASSILALLQHIQAMPDNGTIYLKVKRKEKTITQKAIIHYTSENPIWFNGDISGMYYSIILPEMTIDNMDRGWKIENIATNGKGYSFSDPANKSVTIDIWESYNAMFNANYSTTRQDVLDSLIPPSVTNPQKLKINLFPAAKYDQAKDGNKKTTLIVSGGPNGGNVGIAVQAPTNLYDKYQNVFNKILDSLTINDLDVPK